MLSFLSDLAAKRELSRIESHLERQGGCLWLNHRHKESDLAWICRVADKTGRKLYVVNPLSTYQSVVYDPLCGDSDDIARRILGAFPGGGPTYRRIFALMLDGISQANEDLTLSRAASGWGWMADSLSQPMFDFIDRGCTRGQLAGGLDDFKVYAKDVSGRLHVIDRTGLCSGSAVSRREVLVLEEAVRSGAIVYGALPTFHSVEAGHVTDIGRDMLCDIGAMLLNDALDICRREENSTARFATFYNGWYFDHAAREREQKARRLARQREPLVVAEAMEA